AQTGWPSRPFPSLGLLSLEPFPLRRLVAPLGLSHLWVRGASGLAAPYGGAHRLLAAPGLNLVETCEMIGRSVPRAFRGPPAAHRTEGTGFARHHGNQIRPAAPNTLPHPY